MHCDFIEPVFVPEIPVREVAYIRPFASEVWQIAFYSEQVCAIDMSVERPIVAKILMPTSGIISSIGTAISAVGIPSLRLVG